MRSSCSAALAALLTALVCVGAATAAPASDAQVKAALVRAIAAVDVQRGATLAKALAADRVSLSAAKPASAKAKAGRTLALQGLAKGSLAAAEQVKAEQEMTRMQYAGATTQTALASKNLVAAKKLLNRAAVLLGIRQRAH